MKSGFLSFFLTLVILAPCTARAQFQCEDIAPILRTQIEIHRLQKKYDPYLRAKYNWSCHDYFYGSFIDDDYKTIYECLLRGNSNLISTYMDFLLANKESADEAMDGYFGMLYLERKEDIMSALQQYPIDDANYLIYLLRDVAFFVSPAGTLNVDIKAIQAELDTFRKTLHQEP